MSNPKEAATMATATARTTAQSVRDTAPTSVGAPLQRIASIDLVRGAIMVLMAIDHVSASIQACPPAVQRPASSSPDGSHISARPAFVFFAGTCAFLLRTKAGHAPSLSRYLVTRGLMLVLLELTVFKRLVDVQRGLLALPAGRRDLDARLVHGAAGGDDLGCRSPRSP